MDLTPLARAYARHRARRLARENAEQAQERELLRLVRTAAATRFGRDHGFASIRSVAAYQAAVPLRSYEDLRRDYWQAGFPHIDGATWPGPIRQFAVSGGTARDDFKLIPSPHSIMRSHFRAIWELLVQHLLARPSSRLLAGPNLVLYGSRDMRELAPGIVACDLTGLGGDDVPRWVRRFRFLPRDVELLADWEAKIAALARQALGGDIRAVAGYPSWMLFFFARLAEAAGRQEARVAELLPNLELIVHGGVHHGPYRALFERIMEGSRAELRESYAASEGFLAVGDRGFGEGMRLIVDNGLFYEFVPVEEMKSPRPTRRWIADVEPGREYAVILTTCAGLWSYVLGDTVRFLELRPPRLEVSGRLGVWLNAFGEHLIQAQLEEAVAEAALAIGRGVADYTAFAVMPEQPGLPGRHVFVVEFSPPVDSDEAIERFAAVLDAALCRGNGAYRSLRDRGTAVTPPEVRSAPAGTFHAWMKRRGRVGGQNKVPRVLEQAALQRSLLDLLAGR
jgi:hypothetical protein